MLYENWLHTNSLNKKTPICGPLKENISTDCLVIGGGIAGLHAALRLAENGKKVILLEKRICGGSSSGQSAGFLTPESEEDLSKLIKKYGKEKSKVIYNVPTRGLKLIIDTVKKYRFKCDLRKQDSVYLSIGNSHNKKIEEEKKTREESGLPYELLDEKGIRKYHPGIGYKKGIKYPGSYGINSFAYCQEMKNLLIKKGVQIYEDTEVHKIENNTAKTHLGSVKAKNIIICIDKMKKEFDEEYSKKCYHIQVYVSLSEPLSKEEMKSIFPDRELMCWDTKWNYAFYRPVEGNRILIGGSSTLTGYYPKYIHTPRVINNFIKTLKIRFPKIRDVKFTHYWSGLIDVTKDLVPIIDYDKNNKSIQYLMGCAGLNWAAYCGDYIARRLVDKKTENLTEFFSSDRKFTFSDRFQSIFGKPITFALSHLRELLR